MISDSKSEHDDPAAATPLLKDISDHDPVVHEIEHHAKRHVDGVPRWLSFSIEKKDLRYKVEAIGESKVLVMHHACQSRIST